jgi:ribosomal protein L7/L12
MATRRYFAKLEQLTQWKNIYQKYFLNSKLESASQKLDSFQSYRVNILSQAIKSLSQDEREYIWQAYRDSQVQGLGVDPGLFADFFPKLQKDSEYDLDNLKIPDSVCIGLVQKIAKGEKVSAHKAQPVQEVKVEVKAPVKEKTNFDVFLKGFNPDNKVKVIKEIKTLMNLGLKEAKDKVEASLTQPLLVFKNATKEKAAELDEFLRGIGADIELK